MRGGRLAFATRRPGRSGLHTDKCPETQRRSKTSSSQRRRRSICRQQKRKKARYPELVLPGSRCKLVFAGMEVGGRWAQEAYDFVKLLASAKARDTPGVLQGSTYHAWKRRWVTMLSVAGMRAFADSLLHGTASSTDAVDGAQPTLSELQGEEPHAGQVEASRLPLRS